MFFDARSGKAERTTTLQANVEEKGVEFVPRGNRQRNGQEQKQDGS